MFRKTKIVCTLGPAVDSFEGIRALVRAGMNVARINCSHGDWKTRGRWIKWVRRAANEESAHVGILLDLAGPKFRLGDLPDDGLSVKTGQVVKVGTAPGRLPIADKAVLQKLRKGQILLIGDGDVAFRVRSRRGGSITLTALSEGVARSRQGTTVVGEVFDVPIVTPQDIADLREGAKLGVEFIAQSFVQKAEDMVKLRRHASRADPSIQLIAKIEMRNAVRDIERIISASDGIMVARGDLGLQMPMEEVPLIQKRIISLCHAAGKVVITATQMMESMVEHRRPTRAEATDVANAILDGTDALMLSAETASGRYPIETVRYMHRIAKRTERSAVFAKAMSGHALPRSAEATDSVARAAKEIAESVGAKAIISFSTSGFTARLISKHRPRVPILCPTHRLRTARQVSIVWGVRPLMCARFTKTEGMIACGFDAALESGLIKPNDLVVFTAGIPAGKPGTTNMVTLMRVSDPRRKR
ncbi:MAG: pyruvate kinase [Armatimonadetes bacterium]|nr:pyruvate kinase [Armatimonadota bacterium]